MAKPITVSIVGNAGPLKKAVGEADTALGKFGGKIGQFGKIAAVGFAAEIFPGSPALVLRHPDPDKIADGLDVALNPVEILGIRTFRGTAVAGRDGVDEHKVAAIEDAHVVFDETGRGLERSRAVAGKDYPARPEDAEVEPHRRGTGAAVEGEHHRALFGVLHQAAGVADVEYRCLRLALAVPELHFTGRGGVGDHLAAYRHLAVPGNRLLRCFDLRCLLIGCLFGGFVGSSCLETET